MKRGSENIIHSVDVNSNNFGFHNNQINLQIEKNRTKQSTELDANFIF